MIPRYTRPEMAAIWTPEARFGIWLEIETLAAEAMEGMGTIPAGVSQAVRERAAFEVDRIDAILEERQARPEFEKLLRDASYLLTLSFAVSAVLNYALARYLLNSPSGSEAFNAELAKMNLWSWPVIVLPSMAMTMFALWRLLGGLQRVTGLELEQLMHTAPAKK
jgi:hypothetical protein